MMNTLRSAAVPLVRRSYHGGGRQKAWTIPLPQAAAPYPAAQSGEEDRAGSSLASGVERLPFARMAMLEFLGRLPDLLGALARLLSAAANEAHPSPTPVREWQPHAPPEFQVPWQLPVPQRNLTQFLAPRIAECEEPDRLRITVWKIDLAQKAVAFQSIEHQRDLRDEFKEQPIAHTTRSA